MPTPSQIAEVLRFLPIFEQPGFKAGEWGTPGQGEPGVLIMPGLNYSRQVDAFIKVCRNAALILKDFDWSAWVDEAMSYVDRPERVDRADFETLCKLLTAHIRGERFTEGHLLKMFEKGHIVRLLRRLKELTEESGHCSPFPQTGKDIPQRGTQMKTTDGDEMNKRMFGWSDLREHIDNADLGFVCPVAGCSSPRLKERQRKTFKRDDCFKCSQHGIFFSPSTFEYETEAVNILWDFDLLKSHMASKRESRIARDNSEDAVTWNVFRFLERQGLLLPYLSEMAKTPLSEAKSIYWSHDQDTARPWAWLWKARETFETKPAKGSEPDLIVLTDRILFFIEAKITAGNKTQPSKPDNRERTEKYVHGGGDWMKTVFVPGADYDDIVKTEKKYELFRFWLLGTWMAKQLNVDFRLVNLLRDQDEDEKSIETRFRKHLPTDLNGKFLRRTWEDICRFIQNKAPQSAETDTILRYFREKTMGYNSDGRIRKAFGV